MANENHLYSNSLVMLHWTHYLPNSGKIFQYLWTDQSNFPLICSAVSRKDTEVAMTALCVGYVGFVF